MFRIRKGGQTDVVSSDVFLASLHFSHGLDINLCPDKYTVAKM